MKVGISHPRALQTKRLQCPGRPPVAIFKWMHRREVVMQGQGLNKRIVLLETTLNGFN